MPTVRSDSLSEKEQAAIKVIDILFTDFTLQEIFHILMTLLGHFMAKVDMPKEEMHKIIESFKFESKDTEMNNPN
jgi:hypothetical protein